MLQQLVCCQDKSNGSKFDEEQACIWALGLACQWVDWLLLQNSVASISNWWLHVWDLESNACSSLDFTVFGSVNDGNYKLN
jgi:hypothetical protein